MVLATARLLAHASGFSWDEALFVLAPIALIAAVLVVANRRAQRLQDGDAPTASETLGRDADTTAADGAPSNQTGADGIP